MNVAGFWTKADKPLTGCWEWQKAKNPKGYGSVKWNGKSRSAHRVAWELARGSIPVGLFVLHRCDNPPCVKPDHLFLGTIKDNVQDSLRKGRWGDRTGENSGMAKLTWAQVAEIRRRHADGERKQVLAAEYGVARHSISMIVRGQTWRGKVVT